MKIFKDALSKNGYPKSFVELYSEVKPKTNNPIDQLRVNVYLKMVYRGESVAELFQRRLTKTIKANL